MRPGPEASEQRRVDMNSSEWQHDGEQWPASYQWYIWNTQKESLRLSWSAIRTIVEAEFTGAQTLEILGKQKETLFIVKRQLDLTESQTVRANDQISELKALRRSIFHASLHINKDAKRAKQDSALLAEHLSQVVARTPARKTRGNDSKHARCVTFYSTVPSKA